MPTGVLIACAHNSRTGTAGMVPSMEKTTFSNLQVRTVLNRFRLLKIDVTDPSDPVGKTIKQNYGVYGPPALLFFDAQGQEASAKRLYGYLDPNRFLSLLKTLRI